MLGRKCRFHDLAFFDPVIFESLRQLVIDAENKVQYILMPADTYIHTYIGVQLLRNLVPVCRG